MADPEPAVQAAAHVFRSAGWIELKITVGEIAVAVATLLTAIAALIAASMITRSIQRRQSQEEAVQKLLSTLCEGVGQELGTLAELVVECCASNTPVKTADRQKIQLQVRRFSNALGLIETAAIQAKLTHVGGCIAALKELRHELREKIADPLVTAKGLQEGHRRDIEVSVNKTKEALVALQLAIIQR